MFQMVQMEEENVIIYSNNSLQCGYLKYHLATERGFNIIHFQPVRYLDIRWNPHLPPVNIMSLKLIQQSYQTNNR